MNFQEAVRKELENLLLKACVFCKDDDKDIQYTTLSAILALHEQEVEILQYKLNAWYSIFETNQLTHASARLEAAEDKVGRLEREVKELVEAAKGVLHIIEDVHIPGSSHPESATGKLRQALSKYEQSGEGK